ncbi:uncharacterized protein LOC134280979 isoform X2 [Saccostrea cucullata]|uniref:uncharacterized protein LOC134280979 isoform X2 n=1 Tax=Saccostrea cuccullata TaxID=36930 RepID=UPI002ED23CF4
MSEQNAINILLVFLHLVSGIQIEFEDGSLIFDWKQTISSDGPFHVIITRDSQSSEMFTINNKSFVVHDLLNFSSVSISVKQQKDWAITYYNKTFEVAVLSSSSGYDKVIHWEMPYFPKSGDIRIFHEQRPKEPILKIEDPNVFCRNPHKYKYMSFPVNSVFVNFTIINTTLNDAGFYYDKIHLSDVADTGEPTRPIINGQSKIKVGELVNLTCYSRSTSTPIYYKQFPQLRYTWFINGTEVPSFRGGVFVFTAKKNHRFIPITCQSTEFESSQMSDIFFIDVVGNDEYFAKPLTTITTTRNSISTTERFLTDENYLRVDSGDEMNIMVIIIVFLTSVIIILITWILFIKLKRGKMCKKNLKRKTLSSQYLTPSADYGNSTLSIIYNRNGADHYHQINEDSTSYIYIDL